MKYYREIDIALSKDKDSKAFSGDAKVLENKKINTIGFYNIPRHEALLEEIPEIKNAFEKFNLKIQTIAFYITNKPTIDYVPADQPIKNLYHTVKNPIHTDLYPHKARINIPVLNTRGTFTRFFANCNLKPWVNPFTGTTFELITNTDYVEVDAVEIFLLMRLNKHLKL